MVRIANLVDEAVDLWFKELDGVMNDPEITEEDQIFYNNTYGTREERVRVLTAFRAHVRALEE